MQHIIATTRIEPSGTHVRHCARVALGAAACGIACMLAVGCRSGSEQDLIARELRMQEDQLYAMDDYLTQYQNLLRQARAENRELKCQLAEQSGELPEPAPRQAPTTPPRDTTPSAEPRTNGAPATLPPTEIEAPDIPTLEETTSSEPSLGPTAPKSLSQNRRGLAHFAESAEQNVPVPLSADGSGIGTKIIGDQDYYERQVVQASAEVGSSDRSEEPFDGVGMTDAAPVASPLTPHVEAPTPAVIDNPLDSGPPSHVWLHGEVVANESGGGPRFVVDVEPLNAALRPTSFAGSLSLMILAEREGNQPRSLARWDFSPADLETIATTSPDIGTLRFHLELPTSAPTNLPLGLWVRLVTETGEKTLAHADLDLGEPGHFSSVLHEHSQTASPHDATSLQVVSRTATKRRRTTPVDVNDGSWTIALPGKSRKLPAPDGQPSGAWRTASEPIPIVMTQSKSASDLNRAAKTYPVEQAAYVSDTHAARRPKFALPTWSPDRAGAATRAVVIDDESPAAALPAWSPER